MAHVWPAETIGRGRCPKVTFLLPRVAYPVARVLLAKVVDKRHSKRKTVLARVGVHHARSYAHDGGSVEGLQTAAKRGGVGESLHLLQKLRRWRSLL